METYMKHSELIDALAAKADISKSDAKKALDALTGIVHEQVSGGNDVNLNGLGRIRVVHTKERTGRNPRTGESITIAAKNRVTFVAAKAVKDAAN